LLTRARDNPYAFWVAHAGPYSCQNPSSLAVLGEASRPFPGNVVCAHSRGLVGLR